MNAPTPYAHTVADRPECEWEPLLDHLALTARLARAHAAAFGSADWGELAGWWHDLGKYQPEFQARLRGSREQVDHAFAGAALALSRGETALPLAFGIAGHHAGLANLQVQGDTRQRPLTMRLRAERGQLTALLPLLPPELANRPLPPFPVFLPTGSAVSASGAEQARRRIELWTRFLFSALVDADFLATEAFHDPGKRAPARGFHGITALRRRLDAHLAGFASDGPVNRLRACVLADCRAAAESTPGLFSLTVPTGGGKTLSSMAFALEHAERHGLRRVIVVIPYTSIIEQNARVYRDVFGEGNVVEHHSAVDEAERMRENGEAEVRRRLAAENWDAPVVVTTNVQFFESLFANQPSRCRKLHNVARSVIVLDEAQTIPADFLNCCLDALRELVDVYGCSVVLSTATQPALQRREALPAGLEGVREIVREPGALSQALRRVAVRWPEGEEPTPYTELAERIAAHRQVLAVVHLRKDARTLAKLFTKGDCLHLSALMCPAHRTAVLDEVRGRLRRRERCRLVATQLIEAGVDVDFPVVYRALAGLDSLAQAAGRCNREGKLERDGAPARGEFIVFRAETSPPPGNLRIGLETTVSMLRRYGDRLDFSDAAFLDEYFRSFYAKCRPDAKAVQPERALLNFATVAQKVKLIEDGYQQPVVVPWGEGPGRAEAFRAGPNRATQRALQPYIVQVPEFSLNALRTAGAVEWVHESVYVLTTPFEHLYDEHFGLAVDERADARPEALVV